MPTARESLCCKEIPQIEEKLQELDIGDVTCITEHEGFHPVCLDQWVLQTAAYQTRQQYGNETTGGPPHKFVTIYEITASIGDADIRYNFCVGLCDTLLIANWLGGVGDTLDVKYELCCRHVQCVKSEIHSHQRTLSMWDLNCNYAV